MTEVIDRTGFDVLPITGADGEHAGAVQLHHGDPFDRILIAQANRVGAVIVSRDAAFAEYRVPVLKA